MLSFGITIDLFGDASGGVFEVFNPIRSEGPTEETQNYYSRWNVYDRAELDDIALNAISNGDGSLESPYSDPQGNRELWPGYEGYDHLLLGSLTFNAGLGESSIELGIGNAANVIIGEYRGAITLLGDSTIELDGDPFVQPNRDYIPDAVATVPEPTTLVLLGLGLAGVLRRRR